MHTIESSVLVPLGLGVIMILLMLTFFLHDQTVLTAEYASTMLEWQMSPGKWDERVCEEESKQWSGMLLITDVSVLKMKGGTVWFRLKTRESYRLFDKALQMMEQGFSAEVEPKVRQLLKTDPYWIRRIWKVVKDA